MIIFKDIVVKLMRKKNRYVGGDGGMEKKYHFHIKKN